MTTPRQGHVRSTQSTAEAAEIERRRADVARLILDGNPYRSIAETLGCAPATVSDDVTAIKGAWRERYAEDFATHA